MISTLPGVRNGGAQSGVYEDETPTAAPAAIETDVTPQVVNDCAPNCAEDAQGLSNGKGGETVGYSTEAQIQGNANANGKAPHITGRK